MKTFEHNAAVVFGVEPIQNVDTGKWQFPEQVYQCLDTASDLLRDGRVDNIIVSGNRAVRQRYITREGGWHPDAECDMGTDYLISERGCPPNKTSGERKSEDTAANFAYTTSDFVIPNRMERIVAITTPVREERIRFFGALVVEPYCEFDVMTIDHKSTPAEQAREQRTLEIQRYGFRDIQPGDIDALKERFYDGEPYQYFKYIDLAAAYNQQLVAA